MAARALDINRLLLRAVIVGLLVMYGVVVVREAWTGDDAFITFRTLENFVHGYGLRWNVAERVQSFTHPLWLFLLVPSYWLTGDAYISGLAMSALCSLIAVWLILTGSKGRPGQTLIVLTAMVLSKAFTEYSTSGLENPLSHAVLAALMVMTAQNVTEPRRAVGVGLILAGLGLTRIDLLLLGGPIALGALRQWRRTILPFATGLVPLAAWLVFSVIYYGTPFPNTAYAKLGADIPPSELVVQGVVYVVDLFGRDPITAFTILLGTATALRERRRVIAAIAVLAYVVYVIRIGGDFMTGRFFTAPLVVSLCLLAGSEARLALSGHVAVLAALMVLGLSVPTPTILSDARFNTRWIENVDVSGIADERGFYFQSMGFLGQKAVRWRGTRGGMDAYLQPVNPDYPKVTVLGAAGRIGFVGGPEWYVIDPMALCDPLLARLPSTVRPWRVGHYERALPAGYVESVGSDSNLIADPEIHSLYDVIREVTRGPLWTARRWQAILALNTGRTSGWKAVQAP